MELFRKRRIPSREILREECPAATKRVLQLWRGTGFFNGFPDRPKGATPGNVHAAFKCESIGEHALCPKIARDESCLDETFDGRWIVERRTVTRMVNGVAGGPTHKLQELPAEEHLHGIGAPMSGGESVHGFDTGWRADTSERALLAGLVIIGPMPRDDEIEARAPEQRVGSAQISEERSQGCGVRGDTREDRTHRYKDARLGRVACHD